MFTQLDEEKFIIEKFENLIENFSDKISNRILDIGANDGITLSNTRALILKYPDLQCYFVEPNPICNKKLISVYNKPQYKIFDFAIADYDGNTNLYCNGSHITENDNGLLSTILLDETKRWGENEKWELVEVEVKKYPFVDVNFDFISIDAEGMDEIIVKQIDLTRTYIVCIEWNSNEDTFNIINSYCTSFSMRLLHKNGINLIYVKNPE
jgi:FkbM family methyltransferase